VSLPCPGSVDQKGVPPCGPPVRVFDPPTGWLGPFVSSLTPDHGPATGGTSVIISGRNFSGASAVMFGANPATAFTVVDDNTIAAISPPA